MDEIALDIDRLVITGANVSQVDADIFRRLLQAELERVLLVQRGVNGVDTNSEITRLELVDVDMAEGGNLESLVSEVARRIAMSISPLEADQEI